MPKTPPEDDVTLPFPVAPVSNMEWVPNGITPKQRVAAQLIREETEARAKRHGLTRGQFLRTAAATATAFMVLNKLHGLDQSGDAAAMPLKKVHCDDIAAGRELLGRKLFVMDVQQHHVDTAAFPGTGTCFLAFTPELRANCPESIAQNNFIREVYVNSETDVGVISGLPYGAPMGPDAMAATRDLINQLAGSERALSQAIIDPKAPQGTVTSLETLEYQVKTLKGRALKTYTYSYDGWRLDDEDLAYPMLQKAQDLGLRLVNCHKGLPAIFARGSSESVRTTDFPKVVRDFPKLNFCAYHSGWFQDDTHPEGKLGNSEFIEIVQAMPKKHRKRCYAEIGSTFAFILLDQGPEGAARFMGQLLKTFGSRNILWGTDSIWWGSPQFLIDAFKNLQIPAPMREQYGFPQLTERVKKRILGENAARLYGVKRKAKRCTINVDQLATLQEAQGGAREGRSLRWWGPQTRRQFFAMLRREKQLVG
ncbi:MAG: amidohydrolase family protein [bacterium]|nr:amidohydrolase family protein [bacterium]